MQTLEVKIRGFAPDLDITTPGIFVDASNFVPYMAGFGPAPKDAPSGAALLDDTCRGAAAVRKIDDSSRVLAGTQIALWELNDGNWDDVSKGGGYVGGPETRWRFCQFGNITITTNRADPVQSSTSGAFDDLGTNCPKATLCESVAGFVMLFNYNDGVNDYGDGWYCSPFQNPDGDWTASIATQAANGRLFDTPGSIRAGKRLGNQIVAYKERSMYVGTYQGPPIIWSWQLVPGEVGAASQEAVVDCIIDNVPVHLFAGYDDIYLFDGTRPVSIGEGVREWYNNNVPAAYRSRIQGLHDRAKGMVYFILPEDDGELNRALVFNYRTKQYGFTENIQEVSAVLEYLTAGVTYHGLGDLYSTFDDLPEDIAFDSPFWSAGSPVPALFLNRSLRLYTGIPTDSDSSYVEFGVTGDDFLHRTVMRIKPKLVSGAPAEGELVLYHGKSPVSLTAAGPSGPLIASYTSHNKFDIIMSDLWFQPAVEIFGDYRITGYTFFYEEDGEE